MVAGFSRAVDVDRTAEHEAWHILFRRRARSAERNSFEPGINTDLSATAPCEATIASAVALDMFRPLRLDFGAEATADRLVERCEVVARDRLAHTDFRDGIARRDNFFSYNSKVAAMPRLNDGVRPVVRGIKRGLV
jgi:hypothetical protein